MFAHLQRKNILDYLILESLRHMKSIMVYVLFSLQAHPAVIMILIELILPTASILLTTLLIWLNTYEEVING